MMEHSSIVHHKSNLLLSELVEYSRDVVGFQLQENLAHRQSQFRGIPRELRTSFSTLYAGQIGPEHYTVSKHIYIVSDIQDAL